MWISGKQTTKCKGNFNDELLKIDHEMSDEEARISLAKFFRYNIKFTVQFLTGIKLVPFQEMILRGWFNRNFCMFVACRGSGKSFLAAIYCILKCLFEPNTKILIASSNFRTSRRIFNEIEKILAMPEAHMLVQCFGKPNKRSDMFEWPINGGSITAIPLSGEKIRGIRANVLLLDEFLLLPQQIVDEVLIPFLASPQNLGDRITIKEQEDELIKRGMIEEKDRVVFEDNAQLIALSSASYTFEHLFTVYKKWKHIIEHPEEHQFEQDQKDAKERNDSTYFISQLSWEIIPDFMIDKSSLEIAKNGGSSKASFQREWCAQFVDGGEGYFSPIAMNACTKKAGEFPTTEIRGDENAKYILGVDPNVSSSKKADFFAMSLLKLDDNDKTATLVHSYQNAGGTVRDHINYFYYLYTHFNIVMIILDNQGGEQFIEAANASELFRAKKLKINIFEFNTDLEGDDYAKEVEEARNRYNWEDKRIAFKFIFNSTSIRRANENLQVCIDRRRIFFASNANDDEDIIENVLKSDIPLDLIQPAEDTDRIEKEERVKLNVRDFIQRQDFLVKDTKDQCALIEPTPNANGSLRFDMPNHLKNLTAVNRPRKDNYTTLFLANWAKKCYYDIMGASLRPKYQEWMPRIF